MKFSKYNQPRKNSKRRPMSAEDKMIAQINAQMIIDSMARNSVDWPEEHDDKHTGDK